jgi:hypothetical protein
MLDMKASRKTSPKPKPEAPELHDEPGWEERFQKGLRRALGTPPKQQKEIKKPRKRAKALLQSVDRTLNTDKAHAKKRLKKLGAC